MTDKTQQDPKITQIELEGRVRQSALAKLREPFDDNLVSYKPQRLCKAEEYDKLEKTSCEICGGYHPANEKGKRRVVGHLSYVGHAAVTKRLLDADPAWFWEPLAFDADGEPHFDESGGMWIRLTVAGVSRLGYGHNEVMKYSEVGSRTKAVIGDAIRNAAMRFGVALEEWHKGELGLPDPAFVGGLGWGGLSGGEEPTGQTGKPEIKTPVASAVAPLGVAAVETPPAKSDEPLAEPGELLFITKKLAALKDADALILQTIGTASLEGLTKANFALLMKAVKGKK